MTEAEPRTGIVNGISSRLILIGDSKFFLGEYKTEGIVDIGDTVEFGSDANDWLTTLTVVKKGNGSTPAAPPKKGGSTTAAAEPKAQKCVLGDCQDKGSHFALNTQRNRWECNISGIDNPNITHCPLVAKKPGVSNDLEKKLASKGFGTSSTVKTATDSIRVVGIYVTHDPKANSLILKVNGANAEYSADKSVIRYLESNDSKVIAGTTMVTIEIEEVPKKGMVAMRIGPGPEPAPEQQKPPVQNPAPKADPPAGQRVQQPPVVDVYPPPHELVVHQVTQPGVGVVLDKEKLNLIKSICAKDCKDSEFELLLYLANKYQLDPLARQIWAVKYGTEPARIFAGRDGYLEIAHRSKMFDGMKSGTKLDEEGNVIGYCEVYRKDMSRPFSVEVSLSEFDTKRNTWAKMPKVMIVKVAESQCLRKAFSITGIYSPEEFDRDVPGGV